MIGLTEERTSIENCSCATKKLKRFESMIRSVGILPYRFESRFYYVRKINIFHNIVSSIYAWIGKEIKIIRIWVFNTKFKFFSPRI